MRLFSSALLFFSGLVFCQDLRAQNLVPNGSFEAFHACPGSYSRKPAEFRVESWRSISAGSPDYFNTCSEGEAAVPYNWAGVSDAFDGYGYAGIYTWMNLARNYREYLHCKLKTPLAKDSLYRVEFRYKLSSYSKFCTDRIGLLLSDSIKPLSHDRPLHIEPSVAFVKDSALTPETGSWELAAAEYKAKGNEQYLTIGNFSDNQRTHYYKIRFRPAAEPMLAQSAYYYIDDVKVIPLFPAEPDTVTPFLTDDEPELNKVYVLKDIQFAFNSAALMPVSFAELDRVVRYMQQHPDLFVMLSGHTDDIGSADYNVALSTSRAGNVGVYLVEKGIDPARISTQGYGESRRLLKAENEAARRINRRVEIEFYR